MIQSFIHKGLQELFTEGKSSKVQKSLTSRTLRRLDAIDSAMSLSDLNVPGFNFHGLEGKPKRFSIHVNGPWCLTFEWFEENAYRINLENYH
jgi:proteic killer suppression protein